jgi:superfamily II DNA/RNA helicase
VGRPTDQYDNLIDQLENDSEMEQHDKLKKLKDTVNQQLFSIFEIEKLVRKRYDNKPAGQPIPVIGILHSVRTEEKYDSIAAYKTNTQKYHNSLPSEEQDKRLSSPVLYDFKKGRINILVVSEMCREGFDYPGLKFAIDFSQSQSEVNAIQKIGRLLRKHPTKTEQSLPHYVIPCLLEKYIELKAPKTTIKTATKKPNFNETEDNDSHGIDPEMLKYQQKLDEAAGGDGKGGPVKTFTADVEVAGQDNDVAGETTTRPKKLRVSCTELELGICFKEYRLDPIKNVEGGASEGYITYEENRQKQKTPLKKKPSDGFFYGRRKSKATRLLKNK